MVFTNSFFFSKLLINSFLALIVKELGLEGIEESEFVRAHLFDLSLCLSEANLSTIMRRNLEVNANHIELGTPFLDKFKEILSLFSLEFLCVL